MMEFMLLFEIFKIIAKFLFILGCVFLGSLIIIVAIIFYLICTSEDNCTACPGALDGSCSRCRIHKNRLKREKKEYKKQSKGGKQ